MSGNKDYLCNVCGKKFRRKSCLAMHSKVHGSDKVCSCMMCKEHCMNASSQKRLENTKRQKESCHLGIGKPLNKTTDKASRETLLTKGRAVLLNGNLKSKHELKGKTSKKVVSQSKKNSQGSKKDKALGKYHNPKNNVGSKKTKVPEKAIKKATSANNIAVMVRKKSIPTKGNFLDKANLGSKKSAFMSEKCRLQRNKTKVSNIPVTVNGRTTSLPDLKSYKNMMAPTFKNTFKIFCTKLLHFKMENSCRRQHPKVNTKKILVINLSDKTSQSKSQYRKIERKVNNELHRCFVCSRCYQRKDSLKRHMKRHDKKLSQGLDCWKVRLERLDK